MICQQPGSIQQLTRVQRGKIAPDLPVCPDMAAGGVLAALAVQFVAGGVKALMAV